MVTAFFRLCLARHGRGNTQTAACGKNCRYLARCFPKNESLHFDTTPFHSCYCATRRILQVAPKLHLGITSSAAVCTICHMICVSVDDLEREREKDCYRLSLEKTDTNNLKSAELKPRAFHVPTWTCTRYAISLFMAS